MTITVVKNGVTLQDIANKYKIDPRLIMEVNGLESTTLIPGLALYIPETKLVNRAYIIKAGDTLSEIAKKYLTSISAIKKINIGLSNNIKVGKKILIPSPYKKKLVTMGFAFPTSSGVVFETLDENSDKLSYLAVVAYSFTEVGYTYIDGDDLPLIAKCQQTGVIPLLMIRNFQNGNFDAELAGAVLSSSTYRRNLIDSMLSFVKEKGYGGISMDLEFVPPDARSDYVLFLQELKAELGGLVLQVNVHAKTEDNPSNPIVGGHDYEGIGKVADFVAVMTIDYGYPTGPPDPISPIGWVTEVLQYAVSKISPNILQAAFPMYGYNWLVPSNETSALSAQNAQNLAIERDTIIYYDKKAASPTYSYVQENTKHIVWFEDIRSISAKYQVIDAYELVGATYWQLGLRFPQNWAYMQQNILIIK